MMGSKERHFVPLMEEDVALAQQNEARHDWIEQEGAQDRRVKSRGYQRIADYQMSTTDPDATIMRSKGGVDLGYYTHYVVDGVGLASSSLSW